MHKDGTLYIADSIADRMLLQRAVYAIRFTNNLFGEVFTSVKYPVRKWHRPAGVGLEFIPAYREIVDRPTAMRIPDPDPHEGDEVAAVRAIPEVQAIIAEAAKGQPPEGEHAPQVDPFDDILETAIAEYWRAVPEMEPWEAPGNRLRWARKPGQWPAPVQTVIEFYKKVVPHCPLVTDGHIRYMINQYAGATILGADRERL